MNETLTKQEVAAKLKCCPRYVNILMAEREIPFYRRGHLVRFRLDEVEAFLANIRVSAIGEPKRPMTRIASRPINILEDIQA
jgi:excisionase family DNA binding protein